MVEEKISLLNFDENATGGPTFTSPRTIEACLRLGIEWNELRKKPPEEFEEAGLFQKFQKDRCEHYERKRQAKLTELRLERNAVIDETKKKNAKQSKNSQSPLGKAPAHDNDNGSTSLLEKERRRLRLLEERQRKEFQQLIEYELKVQEIQQAKLNKEEKEQRLQEERQKRKQQKEKEWEQRRKEREDELYALELAEQKRQEELAVRQFQEAQRLQDRERKAEALRRKQARRKEHERRKRQEERIANVERMQLEQEEFVLAQQKDLKKREENRLKVLEEKRERKQREKHHAAEILRLRIEQVKVKEQQNIEQNKKEFNERNELAESRYKKFLENREEQLSKRKAASEARTQMIQQLASSQMEKYARKKEEFLRKEKEAQRREIQLQAQRDMKIQERKEEQKRKRDDRIEAIQRQQRAETYRRQKIMEQIDRDNEVTMLMKEQAKQLVNERRRIGLEARRKKEELFSKVAMIKSRGQFNAETLMRELGFDPAQNTQRERSASSAAERPSSKAKSKRSNSVVPPSAKSTAMPEVGNKALANTMSEEEPKSIQRSTSQPIRRHRRKRRQDRKRFGHLSKSAKKAIQQSGSAYGIDVSWIVEIHGTSQGKPGPKREDKHKKAGSMQNRYQQELAKLLDQEDKRDETRRESYNLVDEKVHDDLDDHCNLERKLTCEKLTNSAREHEKSMLAQMKENAI